MMAGRFPNCDLDGAGSLRVSRPLQQFTEEVEDSARQQHHVLRIFRSCASIARLLNRPPPLLSLSLSMCVCLRVCVCVPAGCAVRRVCVRVLDDDVDDVDDEREMSEERVQRRSSVGGAGAGEGADASINRRRGTARRTGERAETPGTAKLDLGVHSRVTSRPGEFEAIESAA